MRLRPVHNERVITFLATLALSSLAAHPAAAQRQRRVPEIPDPLRVVALQALEFPNVLPGIPRKIPLTDSRHIGVFEIRGPSGAAIRADFILPLVLTGDLGAVLPLQFGAGDAMATQTRNVLTGLPFDPHGPMISSLSGLGRLYLHLGGTALPNLPQAGGLYHGTITIIIADIGS